MPMDEEERNFSSLVLLLLRVGTPRLRDFFKTQWNSSGRSARPWNDSTQNGADLLRIFNPLPYERNKVKSGNSSTWDLSLVIKVLLQSGKPFVSTPNLVAALETLRDIRNKLCHPTSPRIQVRDFRRFWADACNALSLFSAKDNDFNKVKKDVQKPLRFVLPELKECANQERDILSLLQSISSKQENLVGEQQRTFEAVSKTQHENGQQEILEGETAQIQRQRTALEFMSPNQTKPQEGQSSGDKFVTYYITTSNMAVGDKATFLNKYDEPIPTSEHPSKKTCTVDASATKQRREKEFTRKLKSSIKQQTDNFLPRRKDRKIRTDDIFTSVTIQRDPERFAQNEQAEGRVKKREYKVTTRITLLKKCSDMFIFPDTHDPRSEVRHPYPKLILLIGKAGIGKSLFCRKIIRDWAGDKLFDEEEKHVKFPDFWFAFLLTFRQLNSLGDKMPFTLKEVLNHSSILDDHSVIDKDVFEIISENPGKVLTILDGYDEYIHRNSIVGQHFEENYQNDPKEKMPVPVLIAKLLKGKIWKTSVVLVTSRPGEASSLVGNVTFDAIADIKGFSSREVLDYVRKYFKHDEGIKNAVLSHIEMNENLLRFGHIPIMCYLMCFYMEWQLTTKGKTNLPQTRTDLYHKVIKVFIKQHHAHLKSKREITEEELQGIIDRLAQVAVKLTEKKKFAFSEDDMKELGISQEELASLQASGLLDCWPSFIERAPDPFGEDSLEYTFTHLTIQEYLSAFCYVEMMKMIPEKDKTTSMTLLFVAEMLSGKRDKKLLKKLLKTIEPKDEKDDTNRLLYLHCLQGFGDKQFATKRIAEQFEKFCNQNGWVVFRSVTDMDCLSIAYLFNIIKSLKKESERQKRIFKRPFIVNTLYIFESTLATSGVQLICDSLANSAVTELELNCCGLDDTHCVQIIRGLFDSNVTNLNLPYNNITGEDMTTGILQALLHKRCHLKSVNLCGNKLTEECKTFLRRRLRKPKTNLKFVLDESDHSVN